MAANIGPKIGVDGEAEYRKQMEHIIQQAKTLDSEMKLVASSFSAEATEQEKAAAKGQVLTKQIEAQQEKCRLLAEMVQKSAGATGEASVETLKYQDLLNKAEAELNDMTTAQEEASKSTSAFGEGLKKLAGKAVVAGLEAAVEGAKKLASAVVSLVKDSVSGYAEFEQLEGGVKKLFGEENAKAMMQYAQNAYKTAGLSANEYLDQSMSFAAALIDSYGGDTAKAAEQADKAMRAISDNFNTFGGDISSVQSAFQGFAKGQYQLLDNLKLGYGGTKTEMERLIADANEYAAANGRTADLTIENFGDIVEAIELIQEKQGIAGTTAREASTSIAGSLGMAKTAWENLVTGIANPNADIGQLVENVVESAKTAAGNLIPVVETALSGVGQLVTGLAPVIAQELPVLVTTVIPDLLNAAGSMVEAAAGGILENLPQMLETGMTLLLELVNGISEALPELIPKAVEAVLTIVDTLTRPDMLSQLIEAALTLIISLAEGLIAALPELIAKAPEIVANLVTAIVDNAPKLLTSALELVVTLANGIIDNLSEMASAAGKIVATIADGITSLISSFWSVGSDIVKGVWKGISDAYTWVTGKIRGWVNDVIAFFKNLLGIQSPSKVFAEIGGFVSKGFGVGILDNIGEVTGSLKTVAESGMKAFSDGLKNKQADIENALTSIADAVKDIFGEIKSSMDLKGDIAGLEFDVWERQYDAQNAELRDAYKRQEAAQKWLDQAKKAYEINDTETNRMLADAAQLTLDKINEQIEALEDEAAWDKYAKKQEMLSEQFETQTSVVSAAEAAYAEIVKQYGEGSAESLSYQKTLLQETLSWEKLADEIYEVAGAMEKLDSVYKFPGDAWDFVSDPAAEAIRSYIGAGVQEGGTVSTSYGDLTFNISGSNLSVMDVAQKVSSLFAAAWGRKKEVFA